MMKKKVNTLRNNFFLLATCYTLSLGAEGVVDIYDDLEDNVSPELIQDEGGYARKDLMEKKKKQADVEYVIRDSLSGMPINDALKKDSAEKNKSMSAVINLAPDYNPKTFLKVAQGRDVTCEIDGKWRFDSSTGTRISKLNSDFTNYDSIMVPGRSTFDLGFGFSYGRETYGSDVLELGIDIRNRVAFGQPENVTGTTKTEICDNGYSLGEHTHNIGVPLLYVRGIDFTVDLGMIASQTPSEKNFLKIGFFPFELGNGIALGSAYSVTPDFITYAPGDIIQEFAPGFMIYGFLDDIKHVGYKTYFGILKNLSGSLTDINFPSHAREYGRQYNPQRGFGVMNFVFATQLDNILYESKKDKSKITFSPYGLFSHEGEQFVDFLGDSKMNLFTGGFALNAETSRWEFGFECAKNYGQQEVAGIDKNKLNREQRMVNFTIASQDYSVPTFVNTNSEVLYKGTTINADVQNKVAPYLTGTARQSAIDNVYRDSANNTKNIIYSGYTGEGVSDLQNSDSRFRDPYTNNLEGWMLITELTRKLPCEGFLKTADISLGFGMASGDENPNKPLEELNDHAQDSTYEAFMGIQETWVGKKVKSIFMMSGAGKIARILSVPALVNDDTGEMLGYPSKVSRFTNLMYIGSGLNLTFETDNYSWKFNPNALFYSQMNAPVVYDVNIQKKMGKYDPFATTSPCMSSFLGCEVNAFIEANSHAIEGLKFFSAITCFIPGQYYTDMKVVALDKDQKAYMDALANNNNKVKMVPTMSDHCAFYMNTGLEFKF